MLQKISSYRLFFGFFWELRDHLSRILKYHAIFVNTKERSFYQFPALKKAPFYSQKSIISTFSSSEIFIIWTFPLVQSSCFCNNFFLFFRETYVSFNHFKDLLNLHYKRKCEVELGNFLFSEFPMITVWYMLILVTSAIPWNRIWHFKFAETETKMSVF